VPGKTEAFFEKVKLGLEIKIVQFKYVIIEI